MSLSEKNISQAQEKEDKERLLGKRKRAEKAEEAEIENEQVQSEKLLVKNLAFETTADEIRELFMQYGHIKKVRLPSKVNSNHHRGFGFVEFATKDEAKHAFKELQHSHLYNRKLVIEYAKAGSSADAKVAPAIEPVVKDPAAKKRKKLK